MLNKYDKVSIRQSIATVKDKKQQVKIEAELHACTVEEVLETMGVNSVDELEHPKAVQLPPITPLQEPKAFAYTPPTKKSPAKSYSQAVKDDVIKAVVLAGLTQKEAAERYGIPFQTVSNWVIKAKKQRDGFINEAEVIEKEVQAVQELKTASVPSGEKKPFINQDFERTFDRPIDKNIGTKLQDVIDELNATTDNYNKALATLEKFGLLDISFKEQLVEIGIKAQAFKAGIMYANENKTEG